MGVQNHETLMMNAILGIDVGGSHISSALVDAETLSFLADSFISMPIPPDISAGCFLEEITRQIKHQCENFTGTVDALSFSIPGPFDYEKGISHICGVKKLDRLFGLDIRQSLLNRLGEFSPADMSFVNDATAMLTGYSILNGVDGRVLGITLGTGFGSAFIEKGVCLPDGPDIPPGGMLYNQSCEDSIADNFFSTRWFIEEYNQLTGQSVRGVYELAALAAKDRRIKEIFDAFGKRLSVFLLPYLGAFGANTLLIGGNIAAARELFIETLENGLHPLAGKPGIRFIADGESSSITGAAMHHLNNKLHEGDVKKIIRKSSQRLLPAIKPAPVKGKYDIYPAYPVAEGLIGEGFDDLAKELAINKTLVIEGYIGILWDSFIHKLGRAFASLNKSVCFWSIDAALRPEEEVLSLTGPFMGDESSIFGKRYTGELSDFFNAGNLKLVGSDPDCINVIYGCGASLAGREGLLVYADLPKNELQYRSRAGAACNLGLRHPLDPKTAYKRYYFIDWIVLNRHKQKVLPRISLFVDEQRIDPIAFITGDALRGALKSMATNFFRVRPWFEPGPWGGQWIMENIQGLATGVPNYAWSFELIVPENGLLLLSGNRLMECSFDFLMFACSGEVLGHAGEAFGTEFPIRFDFLDTFEGGNLSVQCHPRPEYIKKQFGESFTQDEAYYIIDAKENATVYLGFNDDIDPAGFRSDLENSCKNQTEVKIDKYVQVHPSKKHDLFLIPGGTIHASGKDNLVLEISSTLYIFTFKMYDWLRLDLEGNPRPLNIEHAMNNLYFDRKGGRIKKEFIPDPVTVEEGHDYRIVSLPTHKDHFYEVRRLEFKKRILLETGNRMYVCMLVEGIQVEVIVRNWKRAVFNYAETFVIPAAAGAFELVNTGGGHVKVIQAYIKDIFNL